MVLDLLSGREGCLGANGSYQSKLQCGAENWFLPQRDRARDEETKHCPKSFSESFWWKATCFHTRSKDTFLDWRWSFWWALECDHHHSFRYMYMLVRYGVINPFIGDWADDLMRHGHCSLGSSETSVPFSVQTADLVASGHTRPCTLCHISQPSDTALSPCQLKYTYLETLSLCCCLCLLPKISNPLPSIPGPWRIFANLVWGGRYFLQTSFFGAFCWRQQEVIVQEGLLLTV